ncbi:MAG: hypothetical protein WCH99_14965 [Verrucomicrobiota bacterium]
MVHFASDSVGLAFPINLQLNCLIRRSVSADQFAWFHGVVVELNHRDSPILELHFRIATGAKQHAIHVLQPRWCVIPNPRQAHDQKYGNQDLQSGSSNKLLHTDACAGLEFPSAAWDMGLSKRTGGFASRIIAGIKMDSKGRRPLARGFGRGVRAQTPDGCAESLSSARELLAQAAVHLFFVNHHQLKPATIKTKIIPPHNQATNRRDLRSISDSPKMLLSRISVSASQIRATNSTKYPIKSPMKSQARMWFTIQLIDGGPSVTLELPTGVAGPPIGAAHGSASGGQAEGCLIRLATLLRKPSSAQIAKPIIKPRFQSLVATKKAMAAKAMKTASSHFNIHNCLIKAANEIFMGGF